MGWLFGGMSVVYAHIAGLYQFRYTWGVSEWTVKLSEEVADWYQSLNQKDLAIAKRHFDELRTFGNALGMPRSKNLKGKLYELRFRCQNVERRITYTFEPDRNIITLTTFRKQKNNERKEINRARAALARRKP